MEVTTGVNMMEPCDICQYAGVDNCKYCNLGNPCLGCEDYDVENDTCKSKGGCGHDWRGNE